MKQFRRLRRAAALVLLLSLLLCGCWAEEEAEDFWEPEPPPAEEPAPLKITAFALPYLSGQTLDPITCADGVQHTLGTLLYEGLFSLDERFEPQPCLCADHTRSDDGLTYTFTLRGDVTFSDGSALTLPDVLATYRRAAGSERYGARFANVASMRLSGGALVITLRRPDGRFPALLDIPVVRSGSEGSLVPSGTGPYYFVTDSEGPCLARSANWWRGTLLPLERIPLVSAKSADTVSYLFSSYEVHLLCSDLTGTGAPAPVSGAEIADVPTTDLLYLGFNAARELTADGALRRTMGLAVDRASLADAFFAGHAAAAQFPISPLSPLYPAALEEPYSSSAYAEAIAAAAPEGDAPEEAGPRELTLLVNEENGFKVSAAEYLCRQFTVDGLTVTARILPWADYLNALQNGDFDLYLGEVRLQANWDLTPLLGTDGALNYGAYSDETTDALLAAFLTAQTPESANALCARLAYYAPILPLAFKSASVLTPAGLVDGLSPTASDPFHGFERWTLHLPEG